MMRADPRAPRPRSLATGEEPMTTSTARDPFAYTVAACAANGLAFIIPNTSPFVIGALVTGFPMSEADAGLVLTLELLAMGAAALGVAPFIARLPRRRLAIAAAILVVLANAAVVGGALVPGFTGLVTARLIAGAGAGLVLATANAAVAASVSPPRLYGLTLMVGWLVSAALGPIMAFSVQAAGYAGAYGVWLCLAIVAVPLLAGIGAGPPARATPAGIPDRALVPGLLHVCGVVLVGLSMMAYYAFVERLGQHVGFSLEQVGVLFSAIAGAGALGAGIAGLVGARQGLLRPLLAGTLVHAAVVVLAVNTDSRLLFAAGAIAEGFSFMYLLAYMLAVAAALDPAGRWAAAAGGAFVASTGIGPYAGGALITLRGFSGIGWLMLLSTAVAVTAFAYVGRRLRATAA